MSERLTDDDLARHKRELRLRIGRLRRRMDNRIHAVEKHSRQLFSWRTYVVRYPGWSLLAALSAGMAASAGLRSKPTPQWLGSKLARQAFSQVQHRVWEELKRFWAESAARSSNLASHPANPNGAADE
jgi:hypothetical protein